MQPTSAEEVLAAAVSCALDRTPRPGRPAPPVDRVQRGVQAVASAAAVLYPSADPGTARSAAWKPSFECVPSQNGFLVDAPQRHSATVSLAG